jgi:hypothetical protein
VLYADAVDARASTKHNPNANILPFRISHPPLV